MPGTTDINSPEGLNNIQLNHRDVNGYALKYGQDMNQGAGGAYLYVVCQWDEHEFVKP